MIHHIIPLLLKWEAIRGKVGSVVNAVHCEQQNLGSIVGFLPKYDIYGCLSYNGFPTGINDYLT